MSRTIYTYTTIAVVASSANLFLQYIFLEFFKAAYAIEISIVVATAVVLPFKYVADKKLIFQYVARNIMHDFGKFISYTVVSVFTVIIFWGIEYGAHLIFEQDALRYAAGAIGLAISFLAKYNLDKKYVFTNNLTTAEKNRHF